GTSISGTGEIGATVTVRDAAGAIIGTTTVDEDGNYVFPLSPARIDGEVLGITQSDAAGNVSPGTTVTATDTTPPPPPAATIDDTGRTVTGTGVAGSAVEVRTEGGALLGTATVNIQGNYTVTLTPPQLNSEPLLVTQADAAGNVSDPANLIAPDLTAPEPPIANIAGDGALMSGTGESGAIITITDPAGTIIGTTTVGLDSNWSTALVTPQIHGEPLIVVQSDAAGNESAEVPVTAPNLNGPDAPDPVIATVSPTGETVSGTGESGAVVTVTGPGGVPLGSVTVDGEGNFSITLDTPQTNGEKLIVVQTDTDGNSSVPVIAIAPDITAPAAPTAQIDPTGSAVTGSGEKGATVAVRDAGGTLIGTATVDGQGHYAVSLVPPQTDGSQLSVTQSDAKGNESDPAAVITPDLEAPSAPTGTVVSDGSSVIGSGEAGATVTVSDAAGTVLGTDIVAGNGSYSVTLDPPLTNGEPLTLVQTDAAGNASPEIDITAPDTTAPDAPSGTVTSDGTAVTGAGEAGATITITDVEGTVLGTTVVGVNGAYIVTLTPPLTNGEALTLVQTDAAGNDSVEVDVTAPDITAPAAPTGMIAPDGTVAIGTGEAGATITITDAAGTVLGTTTVVGNGSFIISFDTPQANGEALTLVQTDAAGNVSPSVPIIAPDITAPAAPTGTVTPDGTAVTGTGEAGATISITNVTGTVLGTATVGTNGSYIVLLSMPQVNGETLGVVQTDAAGNGSVEVDVLAPDITAPAAPTGAITPDGAIISGTGEAGATISVTDAAGTVLGTTTVAGNGSYSVMLDTPQTNGEALALVQTDAAGLVSPQVPITAPDITPPDAPTGTVSTDGAVVTGTGEAGATITITDPTGIVIGTATVGANGSYVATLTTPQVNGETLGVIQTDAAGNASAEFGLTAPDITAPAPPTGAISGDGAVVSGAGEAGATISVTNAAGTVLGSTTVAGNGSYSVTLTTPQTNGEALTLVQSDGAGNLSPTVPITAPDTTAPNAPTGTVTPDGSTVTGTGEAGATISITTAAGTVIGTATVGSNGSYVATLTTPQVNGETLGVIQVDAAGNVSVRVPTIAPDITPPAAPAGSVTADGTVVNGTGEAGATITITNPAGAVIGTATVAGNGSYSVTLTTPQTNGETLGIIQADAAGNVSPRVPTIAPDITPPAAPTGSVTADGMVVNGTGEAGATITVTNPAGAVIGTATVAANGGYSLILTTPQTNGQALGITQADVAGNVSPRATTIAPDSTPPAAPTGTISVNGAVVTGTGEAGATIRITNVAGTLLGTAVVATNGSYSATLTTPQTNGERLTLVQADAVGNVSPTVPLTAPDTTPPVAPTAAVSANGGSVTGTGEAGATITVKNAGGTTLGTATVGINGSYTVALTPAQLNGEQLIVAQADGAGNASPNIAVTAPDHTPPTAPTAAVSSTGTVVTGTGEAGATVTVTNAAGLAIGSAVVAANGTYSVTLTQAQANGETIGVVLTDVAGNASTQTSAIAPDITAPNAPVNLAVNTAGTTLTGIGEAGATVRVRDGSGTVIGTGQVGSDGRFSVNLSSPQIGGQNLTVTQTDAAGNQSVPGLVGAPFDIAAFDNSTIALVDLLPVSTAVNHGTANYLLLVSLGLLNLDAQVLATPNVGFTVADGHSLNAVFTYDATLSIGVLAGYAVAVQRWNGSAWVAVGGGSGASLLQLTLLNGNLVSTETLGPGQYRAFVTFDGVLGVGLLGSLNVAGTDSDFTDIGGIVPQQIHGNVITDPSPDGHIDIISPQTVIQSVTVNGVTTAVNANGTVVNGAFGRLVINLDGSYTYTPSPTAASIGKTDVFQYTLIDRSDGETETANLSITIGSDDITAAPVANHDTATASVQYQNVVETVAPTVEFSFSTPILSTRSGSDSFTVAANSQSDVTITVIRGGTVALLPSYTITVKNAAGATVGTYTATTVAGLPLGSGISHTFEDLPPGTYSYTVSSTNVLGTAYGSTVYISESITHFDQYMVSGVTGTQGELLANDVTGTAFPVVKVGTGSGFVEVGETAVTIQGTYGSLTVNETGHYTYTPSSTIPHSTVNLVDSFTYQVVQPNGMSATATLDVTINVGTGATSAVMSIEEASLRMDEAAAVSDDTHQTATLMSDTTTQHMVSPVSGAATSSVSEEATSPTSEEATVSGNDLVEVASSADLVEVASSADPVEASRSEQPATPEANQTDAPVSDEVLGELAQQMFEGQGALEDVLSNYLDHQPLPVPTAPVETSAAPGPASVDLTPADVQQDPLNYLSTTDDIEKHNLNSGHAF
ncbi:BapA/Bap/LapF family large adhesin, partial [Sphingobium sp.]|uniref:BapA/Bap/LapF family large adhesin n=1 Tax=Sphingobium sp. TaxID=1912891 RepID=UPI002B7FC09C